MGKVSDLARELRNHAIDDHTRGCGGRMYSCECGYDLKTERLLRAAAQRIEQLESTLRDMRRASGARPGKDEQEYLHTRGRRWRPHAPAVICVPKKSRPGERRLRV